MQDSEDLRRLPLEPYSTLALEGQWSTGLCDCLASPGGAGLLCLTWWCPCWQFGLNVEQIPRGEVLCAGDRCGACWTFACLGTAVAWLSAVLGLDPNAICFPFQALLQLHVRHHIRTKYNIHGHIALDCLTVWCCMSCALCQEARELTIRGAAARDLNRLRSMQAVPPPVVYPLAMGAPAAPLPPYGLPGSVPGAPAAAPAPAPSAPALPTGSTGGFAKKD